MLLSFSVANFKSFREEQILDLTASALQPAFSWLENAAVPVGKEESALRVKAIYGANASGKSNLIKALEAMLHIGLKSAQQQGLLRHIGGFGFSVAHRTSPSRFELEYVTEGKRYRYGFEVDRKQFLKEWLYDETVRKAKIFVREGQSVSVNKKYFTNPESVALLERGDNALFREDASFLSVLSLFNVGETVRETISFFSEITILNKADEVSLEQEAYKLLLDDKMRDRVISLMKYADINFEKLLVLDRENSEGDDVSPYARMLHNARGRYAVIAMHETEDEGDEMVAWLTEYQESQGTQKLLTLAPFVIRAIETGGILIIDEFEAKLHTRLSREIVSMFNSATGNPNNAQFIFATHDTNLLDHKLLRRDQIDFVEKGEDRASIVYSLSDVKGIRKEADFESDYLSGSYGAVPDVTDFNIAILED